jgi:hypothetical protein
LFLKAQTKVNHRVRGIVTTFEMHFKVNRLETLEKLQRNVKSLKRLSYDSVCE